jgi:hypothetical protein
MQGRLRRVLLGAALFDCHAQSVKATSGVALHRAQGHTGAFGDLSLGEVLVEAQAQHLPLAVREPGQRVDQEYAVEDPVRRRAYVVSPPVGVVGDGVDQGEAPRPGGDTT